MNSKITSTIAVLAFAIAFVAVGVPSVVNADEGVWYGGETYYSNGPSTSNWYGGESYYSSGPTTDTWYGGETYYSNGPSTSNWYGGESYYSSGPTTDYSGYGYYPTTYDTGCYYGCGNYTTDYYYDDYYYSDTYYYQDDYYYGGCTSNCYTYTPPPAPKAPVCTLNANDTSIEKGESVTLTWTTQNATSVALTEHGNVSNNGSRVVSPASTRTYTLTVYGNGGSTNCSKTITVTTPPPPQHNEPVCALSASDNSIEEGDSATLHWTSENATSANLSSFGSVQTGGNRTVSPNHTTTYTLTVYGQGGSDTCSTTIHVDEEEEDDDEPWCELEVSDSRVEEGDRVTLEWDTRNATYASINQGIGRVDEDGGSERVEVDNNTTYRMTVRDEDGDEDTCSVSVRVDEEDDLSSITFYGDAVNNPPTVYLSQLPYTGLEDLSPETMAYWLLLIAGAGGIGYFFFTRNLPVFAPAHIVRSEIEEEATVEENASDDFVEALRNGNTTEAMNQLRLVAADGADVEEFLEEARGQVANDEAIAERLDGALAASRLTGIRGAKTVLEA